MELIVLGPRGSVPNGGKEYIKYGSDTSSYLVMTDGEAVFLDAGTGLLHAPDVGERKVYILLSHLHMDHLLGLSFFVLGNREKEITIYSPFEVDVLKEIMAKVFAPPLWPCYLEDVNNKIEYKCVKDSVDIDDIHINMMWGNHPGNSAIYKLCMGGKVIVYATDYEHTGKKDEELIRFSQDADLLMYDGQYSVEKYEKCKGYGHSTKENGIKIYKECKASRIMFIHHDPHDNDVILSEQEKYYCKLAKNVFFAKQGEVIHL